MTEINYEYPTQHSLNNPQITAKAAWEVTLRRSWEGLSLVSLCSCSLAKSFRGGRSQESHMQIQKKTLFRCSDRVLSISGARMCTHTHPQKRKETSSLAHKQWHDCKILYATSLRSEWTYVPCIFMRIHGAVRCADNMILWLCLRRVVHELEQLSECVHSHHALSCHWLQKEVCGMKAKGKSWAEVKN